MNIKKIVIYGAGGNGIRFYESLKNNFKILFFIDLYSNNEMYDGVKIYKPDLVPRKDIVVLVSVSCYSKQISDNLKKQGYQVCYDFNQSIKKFPAIFNDFYSAESFLKVINKTKADLENLKKLSSMLKDDKSKDALERILAFRLKPSFSTYIENDWKTQYFSDDLPLLLAFNQPIRMLDCGAYVGDTLTIALDYFKENRININSITFFEPNLDNNIILQKVIDKSVSSNFLLVNYPLGVWSKSTQLNFILEKDTSHIVNNKMKNTEQLQVVALDSVVYGSKPNFIKMDVEGAEIEAIKGAKQIIKKYTPVMAIAVYHLTEHLWEIAFLINKINPNYDFYLRTHGDFGNEIILYALPKH